MWGRGSPRVEYSHQSPWRASDKELKFINMILSLTLPPTRSHIFKNLDILALIRFLMPFESSEEQRGIPRWCLCRRVCASTLSQSSADGACHWSLGGGAVSGLEWGGRLTVFGRNDPLHTHDLTVSPDLTYVPTMNFLNSPLYFNSSQDTSIHA